MSIVLTMVQVSLCTNNILHIILISGCGKDTIKVIVFDIDKCHFLMYQYW